MIHTFIQPTFNTHPTKPRGTNPSEMALSRQVHEGLRCDCANFHQVLNDSQSMRVSEQYFRNKLRDKVKEKTMNWERVSKERGVICHRRISTISSQLMGKNLTSKRALRWGSSATIVVVRRIIRKNSNPPPLHPWPMKQADSPLHFGGPKRIGHIFDHDIGWCNPDNVYLGGILTHSSTVSSFDARGGARHMHLSQIHWHFFLTFFQILSLRPGLDQKMNSGQEVAKYCLYHVSLSETETLRGVSQEGYLNSYNTDITLRQHTGNNAGTCYLVVQHNSMGLAILLVISPRSLVWHPTSLNSLPSKESQENNDKYQKGITWLKGYQTFIHLCRHEIRNCIVRSNVI
ncbi:hypothetical protein VP01_3371g1 [Puccinia sorghi]|uniref:Uncharacterized protein n=1 Tax=Puccinia sorghi TaxID=27349 RepID=A0A0L6UWV3_9BASI|nr:hypothetical protein VP01_3371g1 [Puccinia sorghi]